VRRVDFLGVDVQRVHALERAALLRGECRRCRARGALGRGHGGGGLHVRARWRATHVAHEHHVRRKLGDEEVRGRRRRLWIVRTPDTHTHTPSSTDMASRHSARRLSRLMDGSMALHKFWL
jgi:hypothetical protein